MSTLHKEEKTIIINNIGTLSNMDSKTIELLWSKIILKLPSTETNHQQYQNATDVYIYTSSLYLK